MSIADYEVRFARYNDGSPYIFLGVPGASSRVPVKDARHLRRLLDKALAIHDRKMAVGTARDVTTERQILDGAIARLRASCAEYSAALDLPGGEWLPRSLAARNEINVGDIMTLLDDHDRLAVEAESHTPESPT